MTVVNYPALPQKLWQTERPTGRDLFGRFVHEPKLVDVPILISDRSYFDIAQSDEVGYWEFNPDTLTVLKKR